jgi:hypothetical protein
MPQVGFEQTNPLFERAKTVHTLDPGGHYDRRWLRILNSNYKLINTVLNNKKSELGSHKITSCCKETSSVIN